VDFLETQLSLIKDLGLENYLIEQMGEEEKN
jgi:bacterioferritin (cytochrome b1)